MTNHCPPEEVLASTPRNGRFLYGAVTRTPPAWVEDFFTGLGVPLKVERGNRVFPVSDRAADVIDALFFHMKKLNIPVTQARASQICLEEGRVSGVETDCGFFPCRAAVLATGGCSYPATGSTGDGYEMAPGLGPYCGLSRSIPGPLGGRGGLLRTNAGPGAEKCVPPGQEPEGEGGLSGAGGAAVHPFWPLRSPGAQRQRPYAGLCQGAVHLCHRPEAGSGGTEVGRPAGPGALGAAPTGTFRTSWAV